VAEDLIIFQCIHIISPDSTPIIYARYDYGTKRIFRLSMAFIGQTCIYSRE